MQIQLKYLFWVFGMVRIVFSSAFYLYYIHCCRMYITHIKCNPRTICSSKNTAGKPSAFFLEITKKKQYLFLKMRRWYLDTPKSLIKQILIIHVLPGRASCGVGIVDGRDIESPMLNRPAAGWWCNTDWTNNNRRAESGNRENTLLKIEITMLLVSGWI